MMARQWGGSRVKLKPKPRPTVFPGTTDQRMWAEVAWYQQHGSYPDRIVTNPDGNQYVIGDASWNAGRSRRYQERIEDDMENGLRSAYKYIPLPPKL